jgi:anti-sigma-K factor RskA
MNHETPNNEVRERAALYSLGALSQTEARAFEDHLATGCSPCADELAAFERTVGELGVAGPPIEPPDYLRDILLSRVDREQSAPAPVISFPESRVPRSEPPELSKRSIWAAWAVAAGLALMAVVSVVLWRQARNESASRSVELAYARDEIQQLRTQLDEEKETETELAQINSVLSSTGSRVVELKGLGPAASSSSKIYWDVAGKRWAVAINLPPPPPDKVYQLWFVTADAKISAGLISSNRNGHGFIVIDLPPRLGRLAAAAVTLEPEGGSAQPTMPILALAEITS